MLNPLSVGIGLRAPHYRAVLEETPPLDFLEVHSENFFHAGGLAIHTLERARAAYPISLHGVGLSLGSADPLREAHLQKLAALVERIDPVLVSEHLCWGAVDSAHLADLLPFPPTWVALDTVCTRIDTLQNCLRRTVLIENISTYLRFRDEEMSECAFLAELAQRTGCGILLDVNNLYVNARNFGFDPLSELQKLPSTSVGEIHLAGHAQGEHCLIDTHGSPVCEAVWTLYREAIHHCGPVPTLIERDTDIPPLHALLAEAEHARRVMQEMTEPAYA